MSDELQPLSLDAMMRRAEVRDVCFGIIQHIMQGATFRDINIRADFAAALWSKPGYATVTGPELLDRLLSATDMALTAERSSRDSDAEIAERLEWEEATAEPREVLRWAYMTVPF